MMRATVVAVSLAALFAGCGRALPEETSSGTGGGTGGGGGGTGAGTAGGGSGTGGTAGGGGGTGGGTAGGSGTGGGSAPACGVHSSFGTRLGPRTFGMKGGVYDGPATIERSTPDEVVIAFQPAGVELPSHAKLYSQDPLPALPVGAQVWLTKSPAGDPDYPPFGPDPSWAVAVRDRQGGTLLLGAVYKPTDTILSPIPLGRVVPACTTADPDPCVANGEIVYSTVEVMGDATVTIGDSQTATVPVGGVDYDVRVSAQRLKSGTVTCGNYVNGGGVAADFRARDLASRAASLPIGAPLACAQGNAAGKHINVTRYGSDPTYDGPVFYDRRFDGVPNCYLFAVVGSASAADTTPQLAVCADPDVFSEPTKGQEFWAAVTGDAAALFGPQRGALLLAVAKTTVPISAEAAARIKQTIGVGVETQRRCDYAYSPVGGAVRGLWDFVFDTAPPVRAASDTIADIQIGGINHRVWAETIDDIVSLEIF